MLIIRIATLDGPNRNTVFRFKKAAKQIWIKMQKRMHVKVNMRYNKKMIRES